MFSRRSLVANENFSRRNQRRHRNRLNSGQGSRYGVLLTGRAEGDDFNSKWAPTLNACAMIDRGRGKGLFWRTRSAHVSHAEVALGTNNYFLCEGERWYVVHTLPLREQSVQRYLENQQYRTFLPRYIKTVRHARRLKTIVAPLFSRYLFIVLHLRRDRWRSVNGTYGVATLVMQGDNPLPVVSGAVETILASSTSGGEVRFCSEMKPGQRVRLIAGPFAEQLGILEHLDNSGRVLVLLEMMSGRIPVKLKRSDIIPVSAL